MYELIYGGIPQGFYVLHKCDNPNCVNPSHLVLGTQKENIGDMVAKGRGNWARGNSHGTHTRPGNYIKNHPQGERHGCAKLTWKDVVRIRRLYATGVYSQRDLAEEFKISQPHVGNIVREDNWKINITMIN